MPGNTILTKLFPHTSIPHEVWVNTNLQVKAITSANVVNEMNIISFLKDQPFAFWIKKDNISFDYSKTIRENNVDIFNHKIIRNCSIYPFLDGLHPLQKKYQKDGNTCLSYINYPILYLYQLAVINQIKYFDRQTILEVSDIHKFIRGNQQIDEWNAANNICYEAVYKHTICDSILMINLLADLNAGLGLYGRVEKRKVSCWTIVCEPDKQNILLTKGGEPKLIWNGVDSPKVLINQPFSVLIDCLNNTSPGDGNTFLFIDKVNLSNNIDIRINVKDINNIVQLKKILLGYGLDLIPEELELEMLVITERGIKSEK